MIEKHHAARSDLEQLLAFILRKPIKPDNAASELEQAYTALDELRQTRNDLTGLGNQAPEIEHLLAEADAALEAGEHFSLDKTDQALEKAQQRYGEVIAARQVQLDRDRENQVRLIIRRARIAQARSDRLAAAKLYAQAAQTPNLPPSEQFEYFFHQAHLLDEHGQPFPGPWLHDAATVLTQSCLPLAPDPEVLAMTQHTLGNVYQTLGQRGDGQAAIDHLNQAIEAFENALTIFSAPGMEYYKAGVEDNLAQAKTLLASKRK